MESTPTSSVTQLPLELADQNGFQGSDRRVVLNVGGRHFETFRNTLLKYPQTLLGTMFSERNEKLAKAQDPNGEYFFDRDPDLFPVILNFYRTGKVSIPPHVSREAVIAELDYFQIPYSPDIRVANETIVETLFLVIRQDKTHVSQAAGPNSPNGQSFVSNYFQNLYKISREKSEIVQNIPGCWNDENMLLKKCKMMNDQMNILSAEGWRLHTMTYDSTGTPVSAVMQKTVYL